MIGHERDQEKNERAVGKLSTSLREHEAEMIGLYREREQEADRPMCARIGDLAIARCWPYPDMYRICVVTRVDAEGYPTHLRDGAGTRYADDAREKRGATIMPEQIFLVPRERLAVPAREIAAKYWETHFAGIGQPQHLIDNDLKPYFQEGATTDPARYAVWMWAREAWSKELRAYLAWSEAAA